MIKKLLGVFGVFMALVSCESSERVAGGTGVVPNTGTGQTGPEQLEPSAGGTTSSGSMMERMAPDGQVEYRMEEGSKTYELIDGAVFDVSRGGRDFVSQAYDPEYYSKNYAEIDGNLFRVDADSGQRFPIWRSFDEGFENISGYRDLIGPEGGWTGLTLLEPAAPTVKDSIQLRAAYLSGRTDFQQNRLDVTSERVKSGSKSLRLTAVPPTRDMLVTKASMDTAILHYVNGDDFWFSGWFYLEKGTPLGILDIECSFIDQGPGMRLLFDEEGHARMELKWADKPTYRADTGRTLETGRWIKVKLHLYLAASDRGKIELWFDDDKIIDTNGRTLPVSKAVYDRIQIGITANPAGSTSVMYIDELKISPDPL